MTFHAPPFPPEPDHGSGGVVDPFAGLDARLRELRRVWAEALPAFGVAGRSMDEQFAAMTPDGQLRVLAAHGELRHLLGLFDARLAGGAVAASEGSGEDSLAVRAGCKSAVELLAGVWRMGMPRARELCTVGEATNPRHTLLGEVLPPVFPGLAEVLDPTTAGTQDPVAADAASDGAAVEVNGRPVVSVEQAATIIHQLRPARPSVPVECFVDAERTLIGWAPSLTMQDLRTAGTRVRAHLDQDGIEPREARLKARRGLSFRELEDGMTRIIWDLDPESAGYVRASVDGRVKALLQRPRFTDLQATDPEGGQAEEMPEMPDPRTMTQLRSDVAMDVFRHDAACSGSDAVRPPVTMVVRMTLNELLTGLGTASIDGVTEPISAATARKLAADAELIPAVLGGDSEVLDWGRGKRLFTKQQKLALAERDGGCAWAGCPHSPSYTEAHHIRWWDAHHGNTDLNNGILLCSHHHHRVHADGWGIRVDRNVPYFLPPVHVDPYRRPRKGGRINRTGFERESSEQDG